MNHPAMLIDTHCHLYLEHFEEDLREVLDRAAEAGVGHVFMPAINFGSLEQMDHLHHPQIRFHRMAGIHPTDINEGTFATEEELYSRCEGEDIVGVGETGLDYYWSDGHRGEQQRSLRIHCSVARALQKPVILHNRSSTGDLLRIMEEEQDGTLSGIWHCFNGSVEEGRRAIGMGLHLGIGGVLTFKNAGVDKTVAELPPDRMVLETDAPWLTPEPHRGQRNEPSYVRFTATRLAEVTGRSVEEIGEMTTRTALELFRIGS